MDTLDIARWQFAITTVYHFLFVPVSIGLSAFVAAYETAWLRTRDERWLRLTKFFGKLFLINFAIGVVTGIVQEFQFGMNWSDYSRFVGDIFGAPLAIEGLLAFFLESTFLGLWIFGWDRLPEKVHNACIWLVHIGTLLSAYFILAANSWMQHPVGYHYNPVSGRAELNDFAAVMFNKVQLATFPHVIAASYLTAAALVVGVAFWQLRRQAAGGAEHGMYLRAARTGAGVLLVAGLGVAATGDVSGKIMTDVQPMKMAAAEALYHTEKPASFSLFSVGPLNGQSENFAIRVPDVLSFLATGSTHGRVVGIDELRTQYQHTYGTDPGRAYYSGGGYTPYIPLTYWTFRLMIGLGLVAAGFAAWILMVTRRGRAPAGKGVLWAAVTLPFLPLLANSAGWIFTEMGRQPWAVFGVLTTARSVSPGVSTADAFVSLVTLTLVYAVLAVIEVRLMLSTIARGADPVPEQPDDTAGGEDRPLVFAY